MAKVPPNLVFCSESPFFDYCLHLQGQSGRDAYWERVTGWVGTESVEGSVPIKHVHNLSDAGACKRFLKSFINASEEKALQDMGHQLDSSFIKLFLVLEAKSNGFVDRSRRTLESLDQFLKPNVQHLTQSLVLVVVDGEFSSKLKADVEELRLKLAEKDYGGDFPPKFLLLTSSDENNVACTNKELVKLAATFVHFLLPQEGLSWLSPIGQGEGTVSILGLRGFVWKRKESLEPIFRETFLEFIRQWISDLSSEPRPPDSLPESWAKGWKEWLEKTWVHLQEIWQRKTLVPMQGSLEERLRILIQEIDENVCDRLRDELNRLGNDKNKKHKIINHSLNLVSFIVQRKLIRRIDDLGESVVNAKEENGRRLQSAMAGFLQKGTGLTMIRNWLSDCVTKIGRVRRDLTEELGKIEKVGPKQVRDAVEDYANDLVRMPDWKSMARSHILIFSLSSCAFYGLSELLYSNSVFPSLLVSLAVSLVLTICTYFSGLWFFKTRNDRLLSDFLRLTRKMIDGLARHRIHRATIELLTGCENELADEIQRFDRAIQQASTTLQNFFPSIKTVPVPPPFIVHESPLDGMAGRGWRQGIERSFEQWKQDIWQRRGGKVHGFLSNTDDLLRDLADDLMNHLAESREVHHCNHPIVCSSIKEEVWKHLAEATLQAKPNRLHVPPGQFESVFFFAPETWKQEAKDPDSIQKFFPSHQYQWTSKDSHDENAVCLIRCLDEVPWIALLEEGQ